MFISKKKWKEKEDFITKIVNESAAKSNEIERLKDNKQDLKMINNALEFANKTLLEENQTLIEWIQKIINDVGCYEVPERSHVQIPIYKMKTEPVYQDVGSEEPYFVKTKKEIILPEIRLVQYR